jgi:hypothetical protein
MSECLHVHTSEVAYRSGKSGLRILRSRRPGFESHKKASVTEMFYLNKNEWMTSGVDVMISQVSAIFAKFQRKIGVYLICRAMV